MTRCLNCGTYSVVDTTFIYFLQDPINPNKGYVGKADNPRKRFVAHIHAVGDFYAARWVRALKARGLRPTLKIIDEIPWEYREQLEIAYIEFFRESGYVLTNSTAGGEGMHNPSEETRIKMSLSHKGQKRTPETCAKIRLVRATQKPPFLGRKHSRHSLEKMSVAQAGKKRTPEQIAKNSAVHVGLQVGKKNPNFGKKHSQEVCDAARIKFPGASSSFFGVSWNASKNKWQGNLNVSGKRTYLGSFVNELDAAHAYDNAARIRCGECAKLNFPD